MIAELKVWIDEQQASAREDLGGHVKIGSTMRAYSQGFADAIARLREWIESHVQLGGGGRFPCTCGGQVASVVRTLPSAGVTLVSAVCRCGRPVAVKLEPAPCAHDGVGTCDGCGVAMTVVGGVVEPHPVPPPEGVRSRSLPRCGGAGRPPRGVRV